MRVQSGVRLWLANSGLVDPEVDTARVESHVGGPITWYLRTMGRSAITFGSHVWFVSEAKRSDLPLLVHELVHVAQYRRLGFARFLFQYLTDLAKARFKYGKGLPLEAPAYERQKMARGLLARSAPVDI